MLVHVSQRASSLVYGALEKVSILLMITVLCSAAAVVIKMGLDQVLLSPIGICLFYSIIKTMEGTTFAALCSQCLFDTAFARCLSAHLPG